MKLEDNKTINSQLKGECPLQPTMEIIQLTKNIRLSPLKNKKPSGYFKRKIDEYGLELIFKKNQSPSSSSSFIELENMNLIEELRSINNLSSPDISFDSYSSSSLYSPELVLPPIKKKLKRSLLEEFNTAALHISDYDILF